MEPGAALIVMADHGPINLPLETIRKAAFDYMDRYSRKERVLHLIDHAMKWQSPQRENACLRQMVNGTLPLDSIVSSSSKMQVVRDQINQV
jgi:DNA-binding NtrC family response regulator